MFFDGSLLQEVFKQLRLKGEISEDEENTCLSRMEFADLKDNQLIINVPSRYYKDRFEDLFQDKISAEISEMEGTNISVYFEVKRPQEAKTVQAQLPIIHEKKESKTHKRPEGLVETYTFDNFVVGDKNLYSREAALAIAKDPGKKFNPCLMVGNVGLGKTHLLQAIGNYIFDHDQSLKIVYVTAEKFVREFIEMLGKSEGGKSMSKSSKNTAFKDKYRKADVLLIDDIHTFQGKSETQEELFHIFNDLYEAKKQIVLTCDRPISELKNLNERLKSRFSRGITVDLRPPDFETKIAIIHKKLESFNAIFPQDVIELIAETVKTNVRDLEAAITNIYSYADLTRKEVTMELAKERLKASNNVQVDEIFSIDRVQRVIADYFNVSINDLKGKKKNKTIVYPRQIAMYICREMTDFPTTEIGLEFGGRDHTTVMHACQKINDLRIADPNLDAMLQNLIRSVREHKEMI